MLTSEGAVSQLRCAGYRVTPQRRAVIDALVGDTSHPSADSIAKRVSERLPGVSLSTVYKTLHEFAASGLIREMDLAGTLRFDPQPADHAHAVCGRCGQVSDVVLPVEVSAGLQHAADGPVHRIDVTLFTVCEECSKR